MRVYGPYLTTTPVYHSHLFPRLAIPYMGMCEFYRIMDELDVVVRRRPTGEKELYMSEEILAYLLLTYGERLDYQDHR